MIVPPPPVRPCEQHLRGIIDHADRTSWHDCSSLEAKRRGRWPKRSEVGGGVFDGAVEAQRSGVRVVVVRRALMVAARSEGCSRWMLINCIPGRMTPSVVTFGHATSPSGPASGRPSEGGTVRAAPQWDHRPRRSSKSTDLGMIVPPLKRSGGGGGRSAARSEGESLTEQSRR